MARAAVLDTFLQDPRLLQLGFSKENILVNYDGDQRPSDTMFMVLTWGQESQLNLAYMFAPIKNLTIWVHMYRQWSTDFVRIDHVLSVIDDIMWNMVDIQGSDGVWMTLAEPLGKSRDLRDDAYQTLCRSASYRILDRVVSAAVQPL